MTDLLSFEDALKAAAKIHNNRHLLLGNGFSIACRPGCFTYGRLLDEADLSKLSVDGLALFASEGTTDFEEIINSLRVAGRIATFYESSDPDLAVRLAADADLVKAALADTLARNHPNNVGDIELGEYEQARQFLASFGHIFTFSYDLLLYWALMQEMDPSIKADDGFRQDHDEPDADWVSWDSYKPFSLNIYYLHGGLHLFEEGPTLKKLTFSRTGVALIDQIREALDNEAYRSSSLRARVQRSLHAFVTMTTSQRAFDLSPLARAHSSSTVTLLPITTPMSFAQLGWRGGTKLSS